MSIFVSYAASDRPLAIRLIDDLKLAGFEVWSDQDVKAGGSWVGTILEQVRRASAFVFLVTARSARSDTFTAELAAALSVAQTPPHARIIPFRVDPEVAGPLYLRHYQGIDASEYAPALRKLMQALRHEAGYSSVSFPSYSNMTTVRREIDRTSELLERQDSERRLDLDSRRWRRLRRELGRTSVASLFTAANIGIFLAGSHGPVELAFAAVVASAAAMYLFTTTKRRVSDSTPGLSEADDV